MSKLLNTDEVTTSHPVDKHVGGRIRLRRILLGLSQEAVAKKLELSFQQLQKYEHGTNRVSASRLWELAKILHCDVPYFFADMPEEIGADLGVPVVTLPIEDKKQELSISREFARIRTPSLRVSAIKILREIANSDPASDTESVAA